MEKPYLIQRVALRKEPKDDLETIDSLFKMDYMGSAEFEFGALPKSLKRLCADFDKLEVFVETSIKNYKDEPLRILYNSERINTEQLEEYIQYIIDIIQERIHLKEMLNMKSWMNGKRPYSRDETTDDDIKYGYNIWWDIDNDIWFCFGKEKIKKLYAALLKTKQKQGW